MSPEFDKACLVCGGTFQCHANNRQKYCPTCKPGVRRIQKRNWIAAERRRQAEARAVNAPVFQHNEEYQAALDAIGGSHKLAEWRTQQEARRRNGLA